MLCVRIIMRYSYLLLVVSLRLSFVSSIPRFLWKNPPWSLREKSSWSNKGPRQRQPELVLLPRGGGDGNGDGDASPFSDNSKKTDTTNNFQIISEKILHNNWRKLISRKVQLPQSQNLVDFEIVSQGDRGGRVSDQAVMVFVWNTSTQTATLIREYMPSVHGFMTTLAAGMVDEKHEDPNTNNAVFDADADAADHDPVYTAAVYELDEECRLQGGTWYKLCEPTAIDKYSTTRVSVYLVVDPSPIAPEAWKERDETEEGMQIVQGITLAELQELIVSGGMTIVAGWATQMAISKLHSLNLA